MVMQCRRLRWAGHVNRVVLVVFRPRILLQESYLVIASRVAVEILGQKLAQ